MAPVNVTLYDFAISDSAPAAHLDRTAQISHHANFEETKVNATAYAVNTNVISGRHSCDGQHKQCPLSTSYQSLCTGIRNACAAPQSLPFTQCKIWVLAPACETRTTRTKQLTMKVCVCVHDAHHTRCCL